MKATIASKGLASFKKILRGEIGQKFGLVPKAENQCWAGLGQRQWVGFFKNYPLRIFWKSFISLTLSIIAKSVQNAIIRLIRNGVLP